MEQELHVLNKLYTLHKHAHTKECYSPEHCGGAVTQSAEPTHCTMSTTMLKRALGTGDLCDNIGLVGVSAKWSYVTASPSHHDRAIDGVGWPASLPYISQNPHFRGNRQSIRNPSSRKGTYGQIWKMTKSDNGKGVKIVKVHFYKSSFSPCRSVSTHVSQKLYRVKK